MKTAISRISHLAFGVFALAAMICIFPGTSRADSVVLNSDGTVTDTTTGITYAMSIEMFTSSSAGLSTLELQPWWGSAATAAAFASAVGPSPESEVDDTGLSALIAYQDDPVTQLLSSYYYVDSTGVTTSETCNPDVYCITHEYYFVATVVTTPEPGTLSTLSAGLLALSLLVGMRRYRGNRLATLA